MIIVGLEQPREFEGDRADDAPDRDDHEAGQQAADHTTDAEILGHFRTRAVSAADDHRLEDKAGQHDPLPFVVFYKFHKPFLSVSFCLFLSLSVSVPFFY